MSFFGAEGFQLVLLRRMADFQPVLVERARAGMGYTATEMREVNAGWQRFIRSKSSPRGVKRYTTVLGEQAAIREQRTGDLTCRLHHWALPLWPELLFEAVEGPGGGVWQEWLVRSPDSTPPEVSASGELDVWKYVVGDLERMFAEVRHLPEDAPNRWASQFAATGADGVVRRQRATFTYGLLQETADVDASV